jgi:hypothetical protein
LDKWKFDASPFLSWLLDLIAEGIFMWLHFGSTNASRRVRWGSKMTFRRSGAGQLCGGPALHLAGRSPFSPAWTNNGLAVLDLFAFITQQTVKIIGENLTRAEGTGQCGKCDHCLLETWGLLCSVDTFWETEVCCTLGTCNQVPAMIRVRTDGRRGPEYSAMSSRAEWMWPRGLRVTAKTIVNGCFHSL